jgi:hypothetical protein
MSWAKSNTTKHTCGGPVFGKKTPGCPRCDELIAGADAVQWARTRSKRCACGMLCEIGDYVCRSCQIRAHNCAASNCGPVCTAFDW